MPRFIDEETNGLTGIMRELIGELREELSHLDERIAIYDRKIRELYRTSEACQRLGMIEGIGPITATALVAAAVCIRRSTRAARIQSDRLAKMVGSSLWILMRSTRFSMPTSVKAISPSSSAL